MLLLLLISYLGTCGTVYYILYKYRFQRKTSISLHVAIDKYSHSLYALGHFVGGLCFLIFSYKFFYIRYNSSTILLLASVGFVVEQVQAFFPHNVRYGRIHKPGAFAMGLFMVMILALAPTIVHLSKGWLIDYLCLAVLYVLAGIYAYRNKLKFYQSQLVFFSAFYLFLLVLLYGGK